METGDAACWWFDVVTWRSFAETCSLNASIRIRFPPPFVPAMTSTQPVHSDAPEVLPLGSPPRPQWRARRRITSDPILRCAMQPVARGTACVLGERAAHSCNSGSVATGWWCAVQSQRAPVALAWLPSGGHHSRSLLWHTVSRKRARRGPAAAIPPTSLAVCRCSCPRSACAAALRRVTESSLAPPIGWPSGAAHAGSAEVAQAPLNLAAGKSAVAAPPPLWLAGRRCNAARFVAHHRHLRERSLGRVPPALAATHGVMTLAVGAYGSDAPTAGGSARVDRRAAAALPHGCHGERSAAARWPQLAAWSPHAERHGPHPSPIHMYGVAMCLRLSWLWLPAACRTFFSHLGGVDSRCPLPPPANARASKTWKA